MSEPLSGARTGRLPWTAVVLLAVITVALAAPALAHLAYRGRILPGVGVGGVDVGGLDLADAAAALDRAGLRASRPVKLEAGGSTWELPPAEIGLSLETEASLVAAMGHGRRGGFLNRSLGVLRTALAGEDLPLVVSLDAAAAERGLARLAAEFDTPPSDARIELEGNTVRGVSALPGRILDQRAALRGLGEVARSGSWPVTDLMLPVTFPDPAITDLGQAVERARGLLAAPLTLRAGEQTWEMGPDVLAGLLRPVAEAGAVGLALDPAGLRAWMAPITQAISRTAQMPRFDFTPPDGLRLLSPGQPGQSIDFDETAARILAADEGQRMVRIGLLTQAPGVSDTATAADLGIREVVGQATSRYAGSAPGRVHNIGLAARQFHGVLIPPGGLISFNEHLGDVSAATGYQKTLIIVDGATQDGIGGGVCQVSTTLFRAGFWAGLPVEERHAHGYRVGYYEQGAPPGFDATIYSPIVDLKMRNDTTGWLLIETSTNPSAATTTFILYGTKPPREVEMGPVVQGKAVPPPPSRTETDPTLPPGSSEIKEYARDGLSVSLTRIIKEGGQERRDTFSSHYVPTGLIVAMGPPAPDATAAPPSP